MLAKIGVARVVVRRARVEKRSFMLEWLECRGSRRRGKRLLCWRPKGFGRTIDDDSVGDLKSALWKGVFDTLVG